MARLVIIHGRSQEFGIPDTLEREWVEATRWGLERVGAPFHDAIPVSLAFYGDYWRADALESTRVRTTDTPTELQRELLIEMLAATDRDAIETVTSRGLWDSLSSLVGTLDDTLGIGEGALRVFVEDVDRYFSAPDLRDRAIQRVVDAVTTGDGEVVLLAHSLGSVVAYDTLRQHPGLPVRGLVTFGSPLGLATVRDRLERTGGELRFPPGVSRWANVFEPRDVVAANRELAGLYTSPDERRVEDLRSEGRDPGMTDLAAAHDAIAYLSSTALAAATRAMVDAIAADPGDARWRAYLPQAVSPDAAPDADIDFSVGAAPPPPTPAPPEREATRSFEQRQQARAVRRMAPEGETAAAAPPAAPPDRDLGYAPEATPPSAESATTRDDMREVTTSAAASFPATVVPGSIHELAFEIGRAASGAVATTLSTMVPQDVRSLDITVLVQAPHFDAVDPETGQLASGTAAVSLDLDNPDALVTGAFHLRAQQTAEAMPTAIWLRFLHDNNPIGLIRIPTAIDPHAGDTTPPPQPASGGVHISPKAPRGAELLLFVIRDDDGSYDITATLTGGLGRSIPRARLGSFPVTGEAWQYASALLDRFKNSAQYPEAERAARIDMLCIDLWRKLPDAFHSFYWEHVHDNVETILVCSEEPYIPWELIKPEREPGDDKNPILGQGFAMARWDDERQIPNPIEVNTFAVVAPAYDQAPLASAAREAAELVDRFGATRIDPGNRAQVIDLLQSEDLQVLHFSGHGEFRNTPDDSRILLADIPLDIFDVNGARFAQNAEPPLVFLNACEVGSQGWSLTQIGGWAEAFCGAGSAAFVGPYWAVNDRVAYKAARLFYERLRNGVTIGEVMREIRAQFHLDTEDRFHPSWLAYSLHCHPNVTVQI